MLFNSRAEQITEYLKTHKKATVEELAKALFASESTVRRELTEMQDAGLIARYRGGAILLDGTGEIALSVRAEKDTLDKEVCAETVLRHLSDSAFADAHTVFIDNSSTCLALAKKLDFSNKTVITNGLHIAMQLAQKPDIRLIMPGGTVNINTGALIGSLAVRTLIDFNIDVSFTSCAGVNGNGAYELSIETAQLKQTALQQSKSNILVAAQNKFSCNAPYRVRELEFYDSIFTTASDEIVLPLIDNGIRIFNK